MQKHISLLVFSMIVGGCSLVSDPNALPKTLGEQSSGYGYVPLDGLAVDQTFDADSCKQASGMPSPKWLPLLQSLPDLSVRFTVADFEPNGTLSFGPAKITASGQVYRAVLDYVNVDAIPENFYIRKFIRKVDGAVVPTNLRTQVLKGEAVVAYEAILVGGGTPREASAPESLRAQNVISLTPEKRANDGWDLVTVPVYVGIGMRLSADVRAMKDGISLSSLDAIGLNAESNALSGTLTVQTLGINGKSIATALPLPSKLDQTTIENGVLALGSSRAILYADNSNSTESKQDDVHETPRIVGLYSPAGTDPLLINALYSELSKQQPRWDRPCGSGVVSLPSVASVSASKH